MKKVTSLLLLLINQTINCFSLTQSQVSGSTFCVLPNLTQSLLKRCVPRVEINKIAIIFN